MASKTSKYPTLTVVFEDRMFKVFFTNPERINMSMLNRMQQLVRRELKTHQAQAFAELRRKERVERPAPMEPIPLEKPEELSKKPKDVDDILDALADAGK